MRYTLAEIKDGTGFPEGVTFEQVETYNGWTNRETWAVALHINNDQGWQEQVHSAIREKLTQEGDDYSFGEVTDSLRALWAGDAIRENVEQTLAPEDSDDFYGCKMSDAIWGAVQDIGSMWRVNWTELGASFLDGLDD